MQTEQKADLAAGDGADAARLHAIARWRSTGRPRPWVIAGLLLLASGSATAGEGLFARTYTTDTTPVGTYEFEQVFRDRSQRAFGQFEAIDSSTEIEYGFTDKLQGSLYLNSVHIAANKSPDDDDPLGGTGFTRHGTYGQSVSAEFIYRARSPYVDGYGLAFYVEPSYMFHDLHNGLKYDGTYELETGLLLQKDFYDDRVVLAYNLFLEVENIRFQGEADHTSELDFNNSLGLSYRFRPNWSAGLEMRNHNEIGSFHVHEHSVYWLGPVLHYGGRKAWFTLGWLEQVYGDPNGYQDDAYVGNHLFLRSHERREISLKFGVPFGG
ncbi:DUF6662 family protein [Xanthomonas theicola]|uniref:Uncharacterized protein n=1 Tax=Xanthomonas theicola TaxID=56464 RepID=A0A2S6ZG68_9XANT|nr:DUF6662 family protein [Xanthomonas theicola]PPT91278.1 hypothetical protein XthCFBP4691_08375 [Xanthomonas theicola]QNH24634.1 hypothetical protein G4Q83_07575 [Xanthomonas theicola]